MKSPLKVLIIGSDSFLGKSLYNKFDSDILFSVYGTSRNDPSKFFLDLNHPFTLDFTQFDVVIILASMTSIKDCQSQPEIAYQTNVLSTITLLRNVCHLAVMLFFSPLILYLVVEEVFILFMML